MTEETIARQIKRMGLDPVIDADGKSVSVVYEMTTMICLYDERRETLSIFGLNRSGLPEDRQGTESQRCHRLNAVTSIGKCFIDGDGHLILAYQAKVWREGDLARILRDGLECLAAMKVMYIRMAMNDIK